MFSKHTIRWAGVVLVLLALLIAGAALARNWNGTNATDDKIKPYGSTNRGRTALDEDYTQFRYVKTTDYGATWTPITQAGDLSTFAPTMNKMPEFSAVTTAGNELCYAVILPNAAVPGVYSMTGPTFTPVLVMAQGDNLFETGYDPAAGRADIGKCPNGDLIMIIWGALANGDNTLWAAKSTNSGVSWGTPWVAADQALVGAYDAANYTQMFHISDMNSNTTAFVLYQRPGASGQDQFVLRIPTAGGMGSVTTIPEYAGHFFSYMFGASKPIAYDPGANWLYVCFFNYNRSGAFVYASNNGGASFTFQANTGVAGSRYPSIALRPDSPTSGTPFLLLNMTITMPVGERACVFFSYDQFGYNGGLWSDPDSLICITRDDFSSTGSVLYVNEAYFWDATHGIATHNSWDEPATGEKVYTTRTTDGGLEWGEFTNHWNYLLDTLDASTMQNAEVVGGTNGVAYVITCARKGLTDLTSPTVVGMELLTDFHTTGPYVVKAYYDDNVGMDTTRTWANWSDPQVNGGAENFFTRDSAWLTDVDKQTGWYFFTVPDTNDAGDHWAVGDTINIYCDGYDVSGLYGTVDWHQFIIVGQEYLGASEPSSVAANEFRLIGNYPNPFNPASRIAFSLPADLRVTLKVYNTLGQEVAVLADNRMMASGQHQLTFDGSGLSSGVYFYTLEAGKYTAVSKMVLMK